MPPFGQNTQLDLRLRRAKNAPQIGLTGVTAGVLESELEEMWLRV